MTVSDSMPVRVAAAGPVAAHLNGRPADVYWSGRTSGLAHIRLLLDAGPSAALIAEVGRVAITGQPDWPATAEHTGAGIGTKVFAGTPTLSVTVPTDRLDATLGFLCSTMDRLTGPELARATATAEETERLRQQRRGPATIARRLATWPEQPPGPHVDSLRPEIVVLADTPGTVEPAAPRDVPAPVHEPTGRGSASGGGAQSWFAACWELSPVDAELAAATELFLFATAGAPFSPLFRALRDELGISYGPRTSVVRRRGGARAWLDLAFPTAHEERVLATTDRILGSDDVDGWMDRARAVLVSSVLAALDVGSGQADALALGRAVGSPTYCWDVAAQLADGDLDLLVGRVPAAVRTLRTASTGSYRA